MALSKQNRLGSSRDFGRVHRQGKRGATQNLAIRALKHRKHLSADGHPSALLCASRHDMESQFGISISRKVSKRAVVRNRIKRQIKAAIREQISQLQSGWQVVIVVRAAAVECEFDDFLRELEYLFKEVGLWIHSKPRPPAPIKRAQAEHS